MSDREELQALRRMAELEKKARGRVPGDVYDPTDLSQYPEATFWENMAAGGGKALYDVGRGIGQAVGLLDRKDIDEVKKRDASLMARPEAKLGNLMGNVATLLPTAAIPGANTVVGAGLIGGGVGALQPVGTDDSRLQNAGEGALFSAAVPALVAGVKAAKAFIEPMYQTGRDNIVARTLERFGRDPELAAKLRGAQELVPGSLPTAAQATGNAGVATLERGAQSADPAIAKAFADREAANNAARLSAVGAIAKDEPSLAAAKAAREAQAAPLYEAAKATETKADKDLVKLLQRPSMQKAMTRAEQLAVEAGEQFNPASVSGLHYAKMALDDMLETGAASGIGKHEAKALQSTRTALLDWLDKASPQYAAARQAYAAGSKSVNQMEIGQYLKDKMQPALNDFGATGRTKAEQYALALRNADETARRATGFKGASMGDVMSPEQMGSLQGVAQDLARKAAAEGAARGVGSNTAQNLASQNLLRQTLGPLGLPQSWAEAVPLAGTFGRAAQFGLKTAEPKIQEQLAEALLNPARAAQLLESLPRNAQGRAIAEELLRYLPSLGAGAGAAVAQQ